MSSFDKITFSGVNYYFQNVKTYRVKWTLKIDLEFCQKQHKHKI